MTRRTERIRRNRHFRLKRDTILFGVGILGIGYETLAHQAERPTLLLLFAARVGLPAFLRGDEHHQSGGDSETDDV
jgi:hypothetical protein